MKTRKIYWLAFPLAIAGVLILGSQSARAAAPSLYISPSQVTVKKGESFKLQIRTDTAGETIEIARAVIRWPTDTFEYQGSSWEDGDFKPDGPDGLFADYVTAIIGRYKQGGVTGDKLLGSITLKALEDNDTAKVEIYKQYASFQSQLVTPEPRKYLEFDVVGSKVVIGTGVKAQPITDRPDGVYLDGNSKVDPEDNSEKTDTPEKQKESDDSKDNETESKSQKAEQQQPSDLNDAKKVNGSSSTAGLWVVISLVVVAAAVGWFIYHRRRKNSKANNAHDTIIEEAAKTSKKP